MGRRPDPAAWQQMGLQAQHKWGGIRVHSGRPKKAKPRGHVARPGITRHDPLHVTMRLAVGRPNLRRHRMYRTLRAAFRRGREKFGFRLVHFNVLGNHLHLICEADDRRALSRGMQGLAIRIARNVNRVAGRRGKLFADRYHLHVLETPREVRNALVYVLRNGVRHGASPAGPFLDVYSSAVYFDGWKEPNRTRLFDDGDHPVVAPRAWLLTTGWKNHGLVSFEEAPHTA
jgi:REP element-mobilizing transposase RayT